MMKSILLFMAIAAILGCSSGADASSPRISSNPAAKTSSFNAAMLAAQMLENQLLCNRSPEPGEVIRAMLKNGLLKETDFGSDGIPVFAPTQNISVFGNSITFVAGWEANDDGEVVAPFSRGPGTAPPLHIAVSFKAKPADLSYKEHRVEGPDGVALGSFSSVDAGSLDRTDNGSTITCYGH